MATEEEWADWREAGDALRPLFVSWPAAGPAERAEMLGHAHASLRRTMGVKRRTTLVFANDIDGDTEGAGYDEDSGYILLLVSNLLDADPTPVLAGLAHEVRHAYQHDVIDGDVEDARAGEWRAAFASYDAHARFNDIANALEIDADDARCEIRAGFSAD
jgi:hypothetical protein